MDFFKNVIESILVHLSGTNRIALEAAKDYGNCSERQKFDFIHGVDHFLSFLKSTDNDLMNSMVTFDVDHDLYKGHLLAPHQIEATAKKPEKVVDVERFFNIWMKRIENAMVQGHQIRQNTEETGPANELEYWRSMMTKYNNIVDFTNSKPFINHLTCLKLSRSKLVKVIS
jgi:dynein heavy chain